MRKGPMKVYSHRDPEAKPILEKISKYAKRAEAMQMPLWVFARNSDPIGIVLIGKEPIQLYAPPGTPMAIIQLIDSKQPREYIGGFAMEALKLATQKDVEYVLATFSSKEEEAISEFKKLDFKEFDDSYRMVCQLDKSFKPSGVLRFDRVQKEEMRKFIKIAKEFLQGSPDITLTLALEHFDELPEDFLNNYYSMERFYFANKNQKTVGILNINTDRGAISNIGVDSQQRGRGFGRQIMLFGLEQLRRSGCKQAYLRVHIENKPAIHLYESLGFVSVERYKTLMWRK